MVSPNHPFYGKCREIYHTWILWVPVFLGIEKNGDFKTSHCSGIDFWSVIVPPKKKNNRTLVWFEFGELHSQVANATPIKYRPNATPSDAQLKTIILGQDDWILIGIGAFFLYQCGVSVWSVLRMRLDSTWRSCWRCKQTSSQLHVEGEGFEYTEYVWFNELRRTKR